MELPKLRENLNIYPKDGRKGSTGSWLIYDNILHKFYQIGYLEYLILSLWHLNNKSKIISSLQEIYKKTISDKHFDEFFQFLVCSRLLQHSKYVSMFEADKPKKSSFIQNFHKLFFYKIHLLRPEKILNIILPYCRWMFSKTFHYLMLITIFVGAFGVVNNFQSYSSTFSDFFSFSDIGLWVSAIIAVKITHEFSHALVAKYYGCSVSSMGVAILVFWPVLFTDTTHAWSLNKRKQRILISSAGVISEVYIAAICSVLWLFLPDGIIKSIAFILSSTAWIASLFINANPFMRFDGYFVLSDFLKIPNLHQAASHCLHQYVDKYIFGIDKQKDLPNINNKMRPKLAFFGLLMWIYRLFLVFAILWLIYNFAFKLLAILLMCIYLTASIILPIYRKIKYLVSMSIKEYDKKTAIRTAIIISTLIIIIAFPWRSKIEAPAILHFKDSSVLYANSDSTVKKILVKHGAKVKKGQQLLILNSHIINYDLKRISIEHKILRWKQKAASISSEYKSVLQTTNKEIEEKKSEFDSVKQKKEQLVIKAPHDGIVFFNSFHINENYSFKKDQEILSVVNPDKKIITGYINEDVVNYFEEKKEAIFYPDDSSFNIETAKIHSVSIAGVEKLEQPYLASIYGGDIKVRKHNEEGIEKLVPEKGIYAIEAIVNDIDNNKNNIPLITRGTMILRSKPHSLGKSFFNFVYSGFLKHSSF